MSQPSLDSFDVSLRRPFSCNASMLQFLANGFIFSSILFNSVELGLFEELEKQEHSSNTLSKQLNTNQDGLERLLLCLVSIGLLEKNQDGIYKNSELAKNMFTGKDNSADVFIHLKRHVYEVFHYISESLKTGKPQFQKASIFKGTPPTEDNYSAFSSLPAEYPLFLKAMNMMAGGVGALIVEQAELSTAKSLIDIGGGGGQIVCDIAEKCPNLRISLFDLPQACSFAQEYIQKRELSHRIKCISGNILENTSNIKEKYEVVLLGGVISDFPPEKRKLILQNAKSLLAENGRLLISETLLNETKDGPLLATILSLYMFIGTGGQNFTPTEMKHMLEEAGFSQVSFFFNNELGARDLIVATL